MCSGSSTSAIKASVNAPGNQQHHPSYDNAACAGSVISTACHPPSRFEESLTSTLPSMVGRDQEAAPKPDGRTQSNTTSILLASTPSMPPSWSMTNPSGRPLFADCQRSNPSMALKSSKSSRGRCCLSHLRFANKLFRHTMVDSAMELRLIPEFSGDSTQNVVEWLEKAELVC